MNNVVALLAISAVLVAIARARRASVRPGGGTVTVVADADGVRRAAADGRGEEVSWDEVTEVSVFTTKVGPHAAAGGAVVLFGSETRGCIVPLDRLDESGLFAHLGRLPGFEPRRLVDAIGGADDDRPSAGDASPLRWFAPRSLPRTTVCWRRADQPST